MDFLQTPVDLTASSRVSAALRAYSPEREDLFLRRVPLISIIDDDELVREAMRGLVRSLGLEAATFASAEEFLDSPGLGDTACIITDVQMKGLSGIDLQERLITEGRQVPIVFMTAFPDARLRARVMEAGAIGFLSKPFKDDSLITFLESAIHG